MAWWQVTSTEIILDDSLASAWTPVVISGNLTICARLLADSWGCWLPTAAVSLDGSGRDNQWCHHLIHDPFHGFCCCCCCCLNISLRGDDAGWLPDRILLSCTWNLTTVPDELLQDILFLCHLWLALYLSRDCMNSVVIVGISGWHSLV